MNRPLPEHLRNAVRISWHISSWCNFSCNYCGVLIFHKRSKSGKKQAHAFDYHSAAEWLEAFRKFPQEKIYLKITGGEPFLDRENFRLMLDGLTRDPRYLIRVDTNGSWDPAYFDGIDKRNILLNISFHPQETDMEHFLPKVRAIRDAGFPVGKINFVLAPENLDDCERAIRVFEKNGFFVNVGAMISSGVYASRLERSDREIEMLEKYNTPIDLFYRLVNPVTKGKLCYHPAFSYYMLYDGSIQVYCMHNPQDLFADGPPPLPREAVPCPAEHCEGCIEMYRALADEPLNETPLGLYPLDEYAAEVKGHRKQQRWRMPLRKLPGVGDFFSPKFTVPKIDAPAVTIPLGAIKPALPHQPVFGAVESLNGAGSIEVRSRDRLSLEGWAASPDDGAPLKELRFHIAGCDLETIRDFHYRPDIAAHFGRPEFVRSGWKAMVYLPALDHGEYRLSITGTSNSGQSAEFWSIPVQVVD